MVIVTPFVVVISTTCLSTTVRILDVRGCAESWEWFKRVFNPFEPFGLVLIFWCGMLVCLVVGDFGEDSSDDSDADTDEEEEEENVEECVSLCIHEWLR